VHGCRGRGRVRRRRQLHLGQQVPESGSSLLGGGAIRERARDSGRRAPDGGDAPRHARAADAEHSPDSADRLLLLRRPHPAHLPEHVDVHRDARVGRRDGRVVARERIPRQLQSAASQLPEHGLQARELHAHGAAADGGAAHDRSESAAVRTGRHRTVRQARTLLKQVDRAIAGNTPRARRAPKRPLRWTDFSRLAPRRAPDARHSG
jgi:hypothetical protein